MVSLITKVILIVQIAIVALLFFIIGSTMEDKNGWMVLLLSIGTVVLIRMIITANNFVLAHRCSCDKPEDCRLKAWQFLRVYLQEFKSTMLSSSWTMPFCSIQKHIVPNASCLPVLLIHGYGCNSGYWYGLSRKLRQASISFHAISLEPMFGSIEDFAPAINDAIDFLRRETGQEQVIIVAHSMGGLVTRAYMCQYGDQKIAKVITLGTPHHGTSLANFGLGKNSLQMQWIGSARDGGPGIWLQQLASKEDKKRYALFVSIYSYHDNIIAPQTSSHLPGARNIALNGIGHVALGLDQRVQQLVIDEIMLVEAAHCHAIEKIAFFA